METGPSSNSALRTVAAPTCAFAAIRSNALAVLICNPDNRDGADIIGYTADILYIL